MVHGMDEGMDNLYSGLDPESLGRCLQRIASARSLAAWEGQDWQFRKYHVPEKRLQIPSSDTAGNRKDINQRGLQTFRFGLSSPVCLPS